MPSSGSMPSSASSAGGGARRTMSKAACNMARSAPVRTSSVPGAFAQQHVDGIDDNRLPRPCFTGENVQCRCEGDGQLIDERKILDVQFGEHNSFIIIAKAVDGGKGREAIRDEEGRIAKNDVVGGRI